MSRAENYIQSLCVAERVDETISGDVAWGIIADYYKPPRGKHCFNMVSKSDDPPLIYKAPCIGEVRVLNWSSTRKTPNGENDVRPVLQVEVFEVIEPDEFKNIFIEDERAVRQVFKSGFYIYNLVRVAFKAGETILAVRIPSKTGAKKAVLFRNKDKLFFESNSHCPKDFWEAKIEPSPLNVSRFMEKLDIVDISDIREISYKYRLSTCAPDKQRARIFLAETPSVEKPFLPYSPEDFAPVFLRRELDTIRRQEEANKKLTKADITELLNIVQISLDDKENLSQILSITDEDVVEQVLTGLKTLIPNIKQDIIKDGAMSAGLRRLLFNDPEIEALCISEGREMWLQQADALKEERVKDLKNLEGHISDLNGQLEHLYEEMDSLKQAIRSNELVLKEKQNAVKSVSDSLNSSIVDYKNDLSKLVRDAAVGSLGPQPFIIHGEAYRDCELVETLTTSADAIHQVLKHNLNRYIDEDSSSAYARFLSISIRSGYHLAAYSESAQTIADVVSATLSGCSAGTVVCADAGCEFLTIRSAIMAMPERVILVEGLLSCEPDQKVLALTRHCHGKILVFSLDDEYNQERISASVFRQVAMIDHLPEIGKGGLTKSVQQLKDAPEREKNPMPAIWNITVTDKVLPLVKKQKELMQIV